jgi:hypothetical protein
MAESRRKADSKKWQPEEPETDEEKQSLLDRLALLIYLEGGAAIIAGMVVLSQFLSAGSPDKTVLLVAGILFGVLVLGVIGTVLARRRANAK